MTEETVTRTAIVTPADRSKPLTVEQVPVDYDTYLGAPYAATFIRHPHAYIIYSEIADPDFDPLNERATLIYCGANSGHTGKVTICGDAFIVGHANPDGHDVDAPELLIDVLTTAKQLVIEEREVFTGPWRRRPGSYGSWEEAYIAAVGVVTVWRHIEAVRVAAA